MDIKSLEWKVCVECFTYNQSRYIDDALDSFCAQQTQFPYVCCIVDDASTDSEPDVLRKYISDNFDINNKEIYYSHKEEFGTLVFAQHKRNRNCFFALILLEKNHYHDILLKLKKKEYIQEWENNSKYVAICEGDDFWTDPQKLQKQVNFMEANPDYTLCVSGADCINAETREKTGSLIPFNSDTDIPVVDLIFRGGGDFGTATFLIKTDALKKIPFDIKKLSFGDYPLQIYMGYLGKVRYLADITAAYRKNSIGSWTERMLSGGLDKRKELWSKQKEVMTTLDRITEFKYSKIFDKAYKNWLFHECLYYRQYKTARNIWRQTEKPLKKYGWTIFGEIHHLNFIFKPLKLAIKLLKKS